MKCMDVIGASTTNGARIQQWGCSGANHQKWKIEAATDGYVYLKNVNSQKCLDVYNGAAGDGTAVPAVELQRQHPADVLAR